MRALANFIRGVFGELGGCVRQVPRRHNSLTSVTKNLVGAIDGKLRVNERLGSFLVPKKGYFRGRTPLSGIVPSRPVRREVCIGGSCPVDWKLVRGKFDVCGD
jgi:hypothetical protein